MLAPQQLLSGFNTQLGSLWASFLSLVRVSTHSRPKAAGIWDNKLWRVVPVSTHSRPKAAGTTTCTFELSMMMFQHTAARRRLVPLLSRPNVIWICFNTQPPEGGWDGRASPFELP